MSKKSVWLTVGTVLLLAMMMVIPVLAQTGDPGGPPSGDGVDPIYIGGNPSCATLNSDNANFPSITSNFGFKINQSPNGTFPLDESLGGTLEGGAPSDPNNSVTISNSNGTFFNWSASLGIDAVIVKGGPNANAFVYVPEDNGDTVLHAPINPENGQPFGLSHIEFCYDYELDPSKTADGEYTRTYTWDITKSVDPDSHTGFAGDSFDSDYDVVVDQTVTDSDFMVTGTIYVANPTPFTVEFEINDTVDGTPAIVDCPTYELAPGANTTCTYSADLGDDNPGDGTNTAEVVSLNPLVNGETVTDDYSFGDPTSVVGYPKINVTDSIQGPLGSATGDKTFEYSDEFTCPTNTSLYVDGTYQFQVPNTATIDETGDFDTATVTLTCYIPVVSKDADTYFERDWTWTIEKSGDQTDLILSTGQSLLVNYDVMVTATPADSAFKVTGTIDVVNPNPDDVMVVALSDVLSSGEAATIIADADCDYAAGVLTVPAGETATCDYEAEPANSNAGTNTATATLNEIDFEGTADYTFVTPDVETDECINVSDDQYGNLGVVCASESPKTFEYSMYVGPYETCGEYEFVNIASFVTNDTQATDSDSHTVNVNVPCGTGCTLTQGYWKTHSQEGPAPYDDAWQNLSELEEDTPFFLSDQTWYEVFWTAPGGNAYYNLAHQYMAAKLNVLNGADAPAEVTAALAQAEELFGDYTPAQVAALKANNADRKLFISLASTLDQYNNGLIGPGHCSE